MTRLSDLLHVACIPGHDEERTIAKVLIGCQTYVDRFLVGDNGSDDVTSEIASRLGAEVIRHGRNM